MARRRRREETTSAPRMAAPPEREPAEPRGRSDWAEAFLPDPEEEGKAMSEDDLAETLGEDFILSATSGADADDEVLDQVVPEELGGPFVETSASEEFATGTDESNPDDATAEPLPRAVRGLADKPRE